MKFDWRGFTEVDFADYCAKMENNLINSYVGCVRVGDLCFDLLLDGWYAKDKDVLTYDLYVGGINTGYGYGKNDYPYDYAEGGAFKDTCIWMTYERFVVMAEKVLRQYIEENDKTFYKDVSLVEKANQELNIW